jgi:tripartite-type tricarboxylate transporter receptor subunit TctC
MSLALRAFAALLLSLVPFAQADAQQWPARPIRFIVSQAAGGTPDIICRMISEQLSVALGQPVVVEDKPGGSNIVGALAAARAPADGYTLFFATAAALVSNPYTFKALPYDPQKDFLPVAMVAKNPFLILVHPSLPANTLPELFAYDKAHPGALSVATDGTRNFSGILATWLNKAGGGSILQVPYAKMPQGVQDTLAGRTQVTILAIPSAAPHIKSGGLKPIGISWPKRLPQYSDVPSMAESYPGVELTGWFVIAAPAGTPAEIVAKLNREFDKILKGPAMTKRLEEFGFYTEGADTPEGTAAFVRAQYELWGKVTREIGLEPE